MITIRKYISEFSKIIRELEEKNWKRNPEDVFWNAQLFFLKVHGGGLAKSKDEIHDILVRHPITCRICQACGDPNETMGICGEDRDNCFYINSKISSSKNE